MSVRTHFGHKAIQIQRGIISNGKYELFLPFDIGRLPKGVRIIWCLTQNHTGHDLGEYDMRHDMSMAVNKPSKRRMFVYVRNIHFPRERSTRSEVI